MQLRKLSESKRWIKYALVERGTVVRRMDYDKKDRVYRYNHQEYTSLTMVRRVMLEDAKSPKPDRKPTSFVLPGLTMFGGIWDNAPKPDPFEDDTIEE